MHQSFPLSPWECHDNLSRRGSVSIGELPSRSIVFPHLLQTSFVLRPGANRNCQLLYILILINGKVQKVYQYVRPSCGSVVWEEDHPFYSPEGGGKNEKLFASFYIDVLQQKEKVVKKTWCSLLALTWTHIGWCGTSDIDMQVPRATTYWPPLTKTCMYQEQQPIGLLHEGDQVLLLPLPLPQRSKPEWKQHKCALQVYRRESK